MKQLKILLLEDNQFDAELIMEKLRSELDYSCNFKRVETKSDFLKQIDDFNPDIILSDYSLPQYNGLIALNDLKNTGKFIPVVIVTGSLNEETAADSIKSGAWDYVVKERLERLPIAVKNTLILKEENLKKRRVEQEIKLLKEKTGLQLRTLYNAIDRAPSSFIITDKSGIIQYVNPEFTKITGYEAEEAVGQKTNLLKSGKHDNKFYNKLWDTILKGNEWRGEIINKKKNGQLYWEEVSISSIMDSDNKIAHFVAVKRDISENKLYEKELIKAKEQAEESNRLKSSFLANMSHEIRTPMNGILGFTELISNEKLSGQDRKYYSKLIKSSTNRLLSLLTNIIDFSKITAGIIEIVKENTNLNQLIENILEESQLSLADGSKNNVEIKFVKTLEDSQADFISDERRLKQVIVNILDNAIKFTKEGFIEIGYKQVREDVIEIYVKDTGIGIDESQFSRIFESFSQVDESVTREYEGAGLGLSISKGLVNALGGEISVESEKSKGSVFRFTISVEKAPKKETASNLLVEFNTYFNGKILIVEDDMINRIYFEEIFTGVTTDVKYAGYGEEAIEIVRNNPEIKIILMDIRLPDITGIEAAEAIKKINPDIKIISQTAYAMYGDREKFLSLGFDDYIEKPVNVDHLFLKLNSFLKK